MEVICSLRLHIVAKGSSLTTVSRNVALYIIRAVTFIGADLL